MNTEKPSMLVVDDDVAFRTALGRAMSARGFSVRLAGSVAEALAVSLVDPPLRYAVIDLRMPGGSGLDLLCALRERDASIKVVMLTGYGSIPTAVEATKLGAVGFLTKPADADDVLRALTGARFEAPAQTPSLARTEWEHINRVLADCDQNISEAARRLGIHRRSLQRKLRRAPG